MTCKRCGYSSEPSVTVPGVCWLCVSRAEMPVESYASGIGGNVSCALALLELWDRPWSPTALRFAYHALHRALTHGCDVLEAALLTDTRSD